MTNPVPLPTLRIRIIFAPDVMIGPGKAELLDQIARTGSIAAAGRAMGMSYKRAWLLVEAMNAMFQGLVVESNRGGPKGGGAALSDLGQRVLQLYRQIEAQTAGTNAAELAELAGLVAQPKPPE